MQRFQKIKWNLKAVSLTWTTESGTETHEHELTSSQTPHEDFERALQALKDDVLELCELYDYEDGVRVSSVTISYSEKSGRRGAVVTALKTLAVANAPLVLNTPHLAQEGENDKGVLPPAMWRRVLALEVEAQAYVDGKRAPKEQRDMFEQRRVTDSTTVPFSFEDTSVTLTSEQLARAAAAVRGEQRDVIVVKEV